jgi:hypothetical protein
LTGTDELTIQQDRTPNGTPGTGFTGQETIDSIIYDFVGTIDAEGNVARIGVSDQGFFIGGGAVESDEINAITVGRSVDPEHIVDSGDYVVWRGQFGRN